MPKENSLTRIYLGRVLSGEVSRDDGTRAVLEGDECCDLLWKQHELFQDAVNYYVLCLAGMLRDAPQELDADEKQSAEALEGWRKQVEENWEKWERRGRKVAGPQGPLTKWLQLSPDASFDQAADKALAICGASRNQQFKAAAYLIESCEDKDLNQVASGKLRCLAASQYDGTADDVAKQQELNRGHELLRLRNFERAQIDPGYFKTRYPLPEELLVGAKAVSQLKHDFEKAVKMQPNLALLRDDFVQILATRCEDLTAIPAGRKPSSLFSHAQIYSVLPDPQIRNFLLEKGKSFLKKAEESAQKTDSVAPRTDELAKGREEGGRYFEFFDNLVLLSDQRTNSNQSEWFDFDKAAFIEALKSPHRYLQDTKTRNELVQELKDEIAAYEGEGSEKKSDSEEEETVVRIPGQKGDKRVELLRELKGELAQEQLGDEEGVEAERFEIRRRTIKGWGEIRKRWLTRKSSASSLDRQSLLSDLRSFQSENPTKIGSAALFQKLAEPRFQPIWREEKQEQWQADDVLSAWVKYSECCDEKESKERPIRFTPAHAFQSPRFFNIPKEGEFGVEHSGVGQVQFGVFWPKPEGGLSPAVASFRYSSPRLKRELLEDRWIQPLLEPFQTAGRWIGKAELRESAVTLYAKGTRRSEFGFPLKVPAIKDFSAEPFDYRAIPKQKITLGLKWPGIAGDERSKNEPWFKTRSSFRVLSVDLGQRFAGAAALLHVHCDPAQSGGRRIGGPTEGSNGAGWYARLEKMMTLRLPGEDVRRVWRSPTKEERARGEEGASFRRELFGARGRSAEAWEVEEAERLFARLDFDPNAEGGSDWESRSFPEHNDLLIRAVKRHQGKIQRFQRWSSFLGDAATPPRVQQALKEISEQSEFPALQVVVGNTDGEMVKRVELVGAMRALLPSARQNLKNAVEVLAHRCLPVRGARFEFLTVEEGESYQLVLKKDATLRKRRRVGQRGLNMKRIEQLTALRKVVMSSNRILMREDGAAAELMKGRELPEPCQFILTKLERLKQQRVFQTAHLILQEALGVQLKPGRGVLEESGTKQQSAWHGSYEKAREPVDMIVIENLSRYRFDQGRSRWENSRLMAWSHRQIALKLKQMCEVVGVPVLEVHAAYSSQFCAKTGVAGFRAEEIGIGFEREFYWKRLIEKGGAEGKYLTELKQRLEAESSSLKKKKFLVPRRGGEFFVPLFGERYQGPKPAIRQADINAAINLGLRAVAQPTQLDINPRLRTKADAKKDGERVAVEEKRLGYKKNSPRFAVEQREKGINPNLFLDVGEIVPWGIARLEDEEKWPLLKGRKYVLAKALFQQIREREWERAMEINRIRAEGWKREREEAPKTVRDRIDAAEFA